MIAKEFIKRRDVTEALNAGFFFFGTVDPDNHEHTSNCKRSGAVKYAGGLAVMRFYQE
jgi:hypothetical protein